MFNPYQPKTAVISRISQQTESIKLFRFNFDQKIWGYNFNFQPGQFIELSIPGWGEAPFAPCSAPGAKYLELSIRKVGRLTNRLHQMKKGDQVSIRGPYGQGWPLGKPEASSNNKNLLIVVGGLGLIPLRSLILGKDKFLGKNTKVQIFYGAKVPDEMLFRYEYLKWRENNIQVDLTIDKENANWRGKTGLVTSLFDNTPLVADARAFICGPPVMYKPVLEKLKEKGFADEDIFLSLERRMHCGVGVCQHCAVGPYYTCKDGPVFAYDKIKDIAEAI